MKAILLTGFEPFGGEKINPSWEAVSRLPDELDGCRLLKCCLPVVYGRCGELLRKKIAEYSPDAVISAGVAGGRTAITPELIAVNFRMASAADNAGVRYDGEKIDPSGPDAIMTHLPVLRMAERLKANGIPASLSLTAGAYVCNDLYYALLKQTVNGCFIHVPPLSVMSMEQIKEGILLCVKLLISAEIY